MVLISENRTTESGSSAHSDELTSDDRSAKDAREVLMGGQIDIAAICAQINADPVCREVLDRLAKS